MDQDRIMAGSTVRFKNNAHHGKTFAVDRVGPPPCGCLGGICRGRPECMRERRLYNSNWLAVLKGLPAKRYRVSSLVLISEGL